MSAIIKFVSPAELLFQPEATYIPARREIKFATPARVPESEKPFWKAATPTRPSAFAIAELTVLALFLVLGIVGIVSCFGELSHLLQTDAVGQIAAKALGGAWGL
jgi:hypothetical protein